MQTCANLCNPVQTSADLFKAVPVHRHPVLVQGRCAAVLMFHTQLALLPAMETEGLELDLMMDDPYGDGVDSPRGAPAELVSATVGNSYVVNLAKMGIKQVKPPLPLIPLALPIRRHSMT